ncbi:PIN domain-containing protein [Pedobacter frigiditerrae]|uniref:PIN domain-containing protein n=1 Tax=Pedobacter frigiditerrae TaxID=2530452 RepID=UPI00292D4D7F|nr:PIN domain-containing protein [Pedobacter frigiditerrae]
MTLNNIFIDSNIVLYLFDTNEPKRLIVQELLSAKPTLNAQVLVEVGNVCKRKFGFSKQQITLLWSDLINDCSCAEINEHTIKDAIRLIKKYDFQLFDAIIIAGALYANAKILYSEDMHHGIVIDETLTIINPFK